jgi:hypothetical protein
VPFAWLTQIQLALCGSLWFHLALYGLALIPLLCPTGHIGFIWALLAPGVPLWSLVGLGLTPALCITPIAALVSQYGPIEINFKTLGLVTARYFIVKSSVYVCLAAFSNYQTTPSMEFFDTIKPSMVFFDTILPPMT